MLLIYASFMKGKYVMMKVLSMDGNNNYQSNKIKKWNKFWPQILVEKSQQVVSGIVGMFYRQCMLVIDGKNSSNDGMCTGKYNSDDGLSTGIMCQAGTRSILGRRSRTSSIRSSSDSAEDCWHV
jgi:hypothetical protein